MIAICTKYIGPTESKPSRVKAYAPDGQSVTLSWHSIDKDNTEDVHRVAAETLRDKMQWKGELIAGSTKEGYVFVFTPKR